MRKLIVSMHISLDGYAAGPNGEMDWIHVDDEIFHYVGNITDNADTAIYGRVTYEMMDNYWPMAANKPDASKHDIQHSRWYNKVDKVVLSNTLKSNEEKKLTIINGNIHEHINKLKEHPGKNIQMFG